LTCSIDGRAILQCNDSDITQGVLGFGVKYCDAEFSDLSIYLIST
jgi:hypothetical protein